jgi:DhnA family fructose-bisphosphate aldolase class Ia
VFAIDHGYFQAPTTGLERIDLTIVPMKYADAIMLTRGMLQLPFRLPSASRSLKMQRRCLLRNCPMNTSCSCRRCHQADAAARLQVFIGGRKADQ